MHGAGQDGGERIDERVRAAHLEHFCPGGAGFPVASSPPAGQGTDRADPVAVLPPAWRNGQACGRCGQPIKPGQDARRRLGRDWVHETCPAAA
jgi:hypothetical protein